MYKPLFAVAPEPQRLRDRSLVPRHGSATILISSPPEIRICGLAQGFQAMAIDRITVRGARQHHLENVNVEIPRNRFTVITGLSDSGESSLAFDTIYAEGHRRYLESLSAYARQFLDQLIKQKQRSDLPRFCHAALTFYSFATR